MEKCESPTQGSNDGILNSRMTPEQEQVYMENCRYEANQSAKCVALMLLLGMVTFVSVLGVGMYICFR